MVSYDPSASSSTKHSTPTFKSFKDLSGSDIIAQIKELQSEGIHYAAEENISSQCEFIFNKDIKGEILVPKKKINDISEFILAGVFEIDPRNFFMTSDAKWTQTNPFGTRFQQIKPACYLLPVQHDKEFSFSAEDFPTILANLRTLENMENPRKQHETHSVIVNNPPNSSAIKITHHLFTVCLLFT
jgi:hypothetical protein